MSPLRIITSGESHGRALIGVIEGIPSGLSLSSQDIDKDLRRRQAAYGRGERMAIESDHADIISGVRWGKTIGSPISIIIENKDWVNWQKAMSVSEDYEGSIKAVTRPRPGHADLTGAIKYNHKDIRNVLERSSARETAIRVAVGAVAKRFLSEFNIRIGSYVTQIGEYRIQAPEFGVKMIDEELLIEIYEKAEESPVRCPDKEVSLLMLKGIDEAKGKGDSLGGIFEVAVTGMPPGLGSYTQYDRRLNARLAMAVMGIQAIKGVEIGLGFEMAKHFGSEVMDEIFYVTKGTDNNSELPNTNLSDVQQFFYRKTNNAGGIEGGMSNAMPIILRAAMKPIPTVRRPLRSVDIVTKEPFEAAYERSDVCAVPAAAVIAEAMTAIVIADAFMEKFGCDNLEEIRRNYQAYIEYLKSF